MIGDESEAVSDELSGLFVPYGTRCTVWYKNANHYSPIRRDSAGRDELRGCERRTPNAKRRTVTSQSSVNAREDQTYALAK
jgi:hypothetical protein